MPYRVNGHLYAYQANGVRAGNSIGCDSPVKCHRLDKRVKIGDPRILNHYVRRCDTCGHLVLTGRDWTVI